MRFIWPPRTGCTSSRQALILKRVKARIGGQNGTFTPSLGTSLHLTQTTLALAVAGGVASALVTDQGNVLAQQLIQPDARSAPVNSNVSRE
jgi:hypothetical protein